MRGGKMNTCNYLTEIELRHPDIYTIESAVWGMGYAIDDERREIAIIRDRGNVVILTKKTGVGSLRRAEKHHRTL